MSLAFSKEYLQSVRRGESPNDFTITTNKIEKF